MKAREAEQQRRCQSKDEFSGVVQARVAALCIGVCIEPTQTVLAEVWDMAKGVIVQAWDRLAETITELGTMLAEAEAISREYDMAV